MRALLAQLTANFYPWENLRDLSVSAVAAWAARKVSIDFALASFPLENRKANNVLHSLG